MKSRRISLVIVFIFLCESVCVQGGGGWISTVIAVVDILGDIHPHDRYLRKQTNELKLLYYVFLCHANA